MSGVQEKGSLEIENLVLGILGNRIIYLLTLFVYILGENIHNLDNDNFLTFFRKVD